MAPRPSWASTLGPAGDKDEKQEQGNNQTVWRKANRVRMIWRVESAHELKIPPAPPIGNLPQIAVLGRSNAGRVF